MADKAVEQDDPMTEAELNAMFKGPCNVTHWMPLKPNPPADLIESGGTQ